MKWKLSLPKPPMLVYYLVKFTGLAPFAVKDNRLCPPSFLDALYPIFVAASYLSCKLITAITPMKYSGTAGGYLGLAGFMTFVHNFQCVPNILFTIIIFLLMYRKIVYLVNELCNISNEFKSLLGIVEDHETFFKNLLTTVVVANAVLISICVVICLMESYWSIYSLIKSSYEMWFVFNTLLIFVQLLSCIRERFALLNRKLQEIFTPPGYVGSSHDRQMHLESHEGLVDVRRVQKFEGLHLELCELLDRTTNLFTAPIIFISLQFLVTLSASCFWIYFVIRTSSLPSGNTEIVSFFIDNLACTVLRMTVVILELLAIAYASTTTWEAGNGIKSVLVEVWNKSMPQDLQDEFFTFHLQLMHKSANVSLFGFLDLYYSYVYTILGAVAGYVIIMVQFGQSKADPGA